MHKISMFAAVATAAIGLASLSSGSAFASCLNSDLPPISLSQSAMNPNVGTEYDKATYDAMLAKGNRCPITEQSLPIGGEANANNTSAPNGVRGNHNGDENRPGV